MINLTQQICDLYDQQQVEWQLFGTALVGLKSVITKELVLDGDRVLAQFNPARIRSTAAVIDKAAIQKRACFLCPQERPSEQRQVVPEGSDYSFLVNPYPVLEKHFTVVKKQHVLQEPVPYMADFFWLLARLSDNWAVIFNGARAGASAPDHLHFQTFPANQLRLFDAFNKRQIDLQLKKQLFKFASISFLMLIENSPESMTASVSEMLGRLEDTELLNIVAWKQDEVYVTFLMPRSKHRPDCYYKEGNQQIMLSPGALEICGVWVFPRRQDFDFITESQLLQIVQEVSCSAEFVTTLLA